MHDYKVINGDLLNAHVDFICHQVNCQGKMGSGVAKAIRDKYIAVYEQYRAYVNKVVDKSKLLGHVQFIQVSNDPEVKPYYVVNMFTQLDFGYDGKQYTSYEAFKMALAEINKNCAGYEVAFPWKIGCVRGGADWNTVLNMICTELTDVKSITFYKL